MLKKNEEYAKEVLIRDETKKKEYKSKYSNVIVTEEPDTDSQEDDEKESLKKKQINAEKRADRKTSSITVKEKKYESKYSNVVAGQVMLQGKDKAKVDAAQKSKYNNVSGAEKVHSIKKEKQKKNKITDNVRSRMIADYVEKMSNDETPEESKRLIVKISNTIMKSMRRLTTFVVSQALHLLLALAAGIVAVIGVPALIIIIVVLALNFCLQEEYYNNFDSRATIEQQLAEVGLSLDNEIYNYTNIINNIDVKQFRAEVALITLAKTGGMLHEELTDEERQVINEVISKLVEVNTVIDTEKVYIYDGEIIGEKDMSYFVYNGHDFSNSDEIELVGDGSYGADGAVDEFEKIRLDYNLDFRFCENVFEAGWTQETLFIGCCVDHRSSIPLGSIIEAKLENGDVYFFQVVCKAHSFQTEENVNELCFMATSKNVLAKSLFYADEFGQMSSANQGTTNQEIIEQHDNNATKFMEEKNVVVSFRTPEGLLEEYPDLFEKAADRIYAFNQEYREGYAVTKEEIQEELENAFSECYGEEGWMYCAANTVDKEADDYEECIVDYNYINKDEYGKMYVLGKTITIDLLDLDMFVTTATDEEGHAYLTLGEQKLINEYYKMYLKGNENINKYIDSIFAGTIQETLVENVLSNVNNSETKYKTMMHMIANEYMKSAVFVPATLRAIVNNFQNGCYEIIKASELEKGDLIFVKKENAVVQYEDETGETIGIEDVYVYVGEGECVTLNATGEFEVNEIPDVVDIAFYGRVCEY